MIYKCEDCGWEFDEYDILWMREIHGELMGHCPNCESPDFDEKRSEQNE